MVVLTVVTHSNPHTVYFDQPIPQPNYIRLLSCSLYNSWYNLKEEGEILLLPDGKKDKNKANVIKKFLPGHYTIDELEKELKSLKKENVDLSMQTHSSSGQMVISNPDNKKIFFDSNLAALIGIKAETTFFKTFIKTLNSPTTYFIHCDLVDREQNIFNGKHSSVLACYNIRGKAYEKINYTSSQLNVLRDVSAEKHLTSMTLSIRDEMGNLFDFNGTNVTYEIELN